MITKYKLQKCQRKQPVVYFEALLLHLAEDAEANQENPRDILSLGRDLQTWPSDNERVVLTIRPCKNERGSQNDLFISRKQDGQRDMQETHFYCSAFEFW